MLEKLYIENKIDQIDPKLWFWEYMKFGNPARLAMWVCNGIRKPIIQKFPWTDGKRKLMCDLFYEPHINDPDVFQENSKYRMSGLYKMLNNAIEDGKCGESNIANKTEQTEKT